MNRKIIVLIAVVAVPLVFLLLGANIFYFIGFLAVLLLLRASLLYFLWDYTAPIPPAPKDAIKVACIGDSITYGSKLRNRAQDCYPAQLEALLGKNYAVRNFGVNGRTMLRSGDRPYWEHRNFRRSSEFEPDIVIIMLGTNDSKKKNWTKVDEYIADYRLMVHHYRDLPSHPAIYVMTPPTAHVLRGKNTLSYTISNEAMNEMSIAILRMAEDEKLFVVDIRAATASHPECFPIDGIHANSEGAELISRTAYAALTGTFRH